MKVTDEQKQQLKTLYWQDKKTLPEIATMFGVSYPAIRRWFIVFDIPRRSNSEAQQLSHGTIHLTKARLTELYCENGLSQSDIAKQFGITQGAIKSRMQKLNIPARSKANFGPRNGMFGRTHTPEAREKIRAANRRQWEKPGARERQAELTAKQIAGGRTGKSFNKLETKFASILDRLHIEYKWQYRLSSFTYDFYLPCYNALVEVHGTFWHADPRFYFRGDLSPIQQRNAINDRRKAKLARQSGHTFLHVWEYDIHNNQDKVDRLLATL